MGSIVAYCGGLSNEIGIRGQHRFSKKPGFQLPAFRNTQLFCLRLPAWEEAGAPPLRSGGDGESVNRTVHGQR